MKSILMIESDAMVRRFLRAALQASNYSVVEAESDALGTSGCYTGKYRRHRPRLHGNPGGRLENVEKAAHRSSSSRDRGDCDERPRPVWLRLTSLGQCLSREAVPAQPTHSKNTRIAGPNCADSASRSTSGAGVSCCFPAVRAPARSIAGAAVV
jgi:hypothetical protein